MRVLGRRLQNFAKFSSLMHPLCNFKTTSLGTGSDPQASSSVVCHGHGFGLGNLRPREFDCVRMNTTLHPKP